MKLNGYSRYLMISASILTCLLVIGLVAGVGSYFGHRMAHQKSIAEMPPIQLNAASAARSKSISMATGLIDNNVEGLFVLDHISGNLQCWVLSPRTGQVGGVYRANIYQAMGTVKGGEADFVMTTGNFFFTGNNSGNVAPGQSVCYVADTKTGKVVGFGLVYN